MVIVNSKVQFDSLFTIKHLLKRFVGRYYKNVKLIPDHLRITFNTNYTKCQDDTTNWFSREREFLDRERESPFRERDKT